MILFYMVLAAQGDRKFELSGLVLGTISLSCQAFLKFGSDNDGFEFSPMVVITSAVLGLISLIQTIAAFRSADETSIEQPKNNSKLHTMFYSAFVLGPVQTSAIFLLFVVLSG